MRPSPASTVEDRAATSLDAGQRKVPLLIDALVTGSAEIGPSAASENKPGIADARLDCPDHG
jgi:hypothetical protein